MTALDVETDDRVVSLFLDGTRHNALDRAGYAAVEQAALRVRSDQVLVIRSRGRHFCSGQDLDEFRRARADGEAADVVRRGAAAVAAVLRCAGPVVVLARGACVGAGALLVSAADVAVMAEDASLRLPELELGLPLGAAVARRLLPDPLVRRMLLTGESVDVSRLAATGAARVVAGEDLERVGDLVVRLLLKLDPEALREARALWNVEARERDARAYEREVVASVRLLDTDSSGGTGSSGGIGSSGAVARSIPPGWWPG